MVYQIILPFEAMYALANASVKFSILMFYIRIFGTDRKFRRNVYIVGGIVAAWATHIVLETFLICRPLSMNWDPAAGGHCGNRNVMFVVAGATNMVTDIMVMALPIPALWKLQMPMIRKIGLMAVFSLGRLCVKMPMI